MKNDALTLAPFILMWVFLPTVVSQVVTVLLLLGLLGIILETLYTKRKGGDLKIERTWKFGLFTIRFLPLP